MANTNIYLITAEQLQTSITETPSVINFEIFMMGIFVKIFVNNVVASIYFFVNSCVIDNLKDDKHR